MGWTSRAFVSAVALMLVGASPVEALAGTCPPAVSAVKAKSRAWKRPAHCPRCEACRGARALRPAYRYDEPPPRYYLVPPPAVVVVPRYEPYVVYQGPFGIYRPYPPVVVYDVPPDYGYWRYSRRYDPWW
jgi:hypothetical protein